MVTCVLVDQHCLMVVSTCRTFVMACTGLVSMSEGQQTSKLSSLSVAEAESPM